MSEALQIAKIKTDGGTQPRAQLSFVVVSEYAEAIANGDKFPPVDVVYDGSDYWLVDGFHRLAACQQLEVDSIEANVTQGTLQDAQWQSYGVNAAHGLRRTNEDKRRAVEAALKHPKAASLSGEEIARHCGVSNATVSRYRQSISYNVRDSEVKTITRNGTTYQMDTSNIGKPSVTDTDILPNSKDEMRLFQLSDDTRQMVIEKMASRQAQTVSQAASQLLQEKREALKEAPLPIPDNKYTTIIVDPPWPIQKIEREVVPEQFAFDYPTMELDDIRGFPVVQEIAADDCHLFLWTTHKFLPAAFDVMQRWGFRYIFTMVWHKNGGFQPFNLPQYNCEFVLYGRRGTPKFLDTKSFFTSFSASRNGHSVKPPEFYDLVKRVCGGPRIEIFSRAERDGFDVWGDEVNE